MTAAPLKVMIALFIVLGTIPIVRSQSDIPYRNERFIFWQPEAVISFSDYVKPPDSTSFRLGKRVGISTISVVELRRVVDVAKRKRDRTKLPEAIYIAPAFCRQCSSRLSDDSISLKHDRMLFDMAEFASRIARAELDSVVRVTHADNTGLMMLETIVSDADDKMRRMFKTYFEEVVMTRSDSAYVSWRSFMDEMLVKSRARATRLVDCQRFIKDAPILDDYIMPKNRIGDLRKSQRN